VDHQLQKLLDFGLEAQGLLFGCGHFFLECRIVSEKKPDFCRKWGLAGGFQEEGGAGGLLQVKSRL
jgi:hypothetical protein